MTKYNHIYEITDVTADSSPLSEPVTVQEAKDWMRLEGFIDDAESTPSDFDDDDSFIETLIKSARERIEEYTGKVLVNKTYQVDLDNLAGNIRLPMQPVIDIVSVEDIDGVSLDYTATSNQQVLKTPVQAGLVVTYEAGYGVLPEWAKNAILTEVAYRYTHRGDEELRGVSTDTLAIITPYREDSTWLA